MKIKYAIIALLDQLLKMLNNLNDKEYSQKVEIFKGTSIGQHTRHIYELIECLVNYQSKEILCYDDRKRDIELEKSRILMISKISQFHKLLIQMPEEGNIQVRHYLGEMGEVIVDSSISRELLFVFDHTVHHLAIIRIGIENHFTNIVLPSDFGFTPSTLRHFAAYN